MATHSSVLAWRIPGTGEPGGLPSLWSHRIGHNWSDLAAAMLNLLKFSMKESNSWNTVWIKWQVQVKIAQLCLTLFNPMNCRLPGSSVHWLLKARILEWVAIPFCRGSSQPRDQAQVSHIAGGVFIIWAIKNVYKLFNHTLGKHYYWCWKLSFTIHWCPNQISETEFWVK